jgi:hypothetical protein
MKTLLKRFVTRTILAVSRSIVGLAFLLSPIWLPVLITLVSNFHDHVMTGKMGLAGFLRDLPLYSYVPVFKWYEDLATEVMTLWFLAHP